MKSVKRLLYSLLILTLVLTGIPYFGVNKANAETNINDLVIDLNVPQVTRAFQKIFRALAAFEEML